MIFYILHSNTTLSHWDPTKFIKDTLLFTETYLYLRTAAKLTK